MIFVKEMFKSQLLATAPTSSNASFFQLSHSLKRHHGISSVNQWKVESLQLIFFEEERNDVGIEQAHIHRRLVPFSISN